MRCRTWAGTALLVSDFYAAYDSLGCPQQKCLIHLIRDMNQELLNNPYDLEFQSITQPFSSLLRSIVATVDEHGLKRRHLKRHTTEVTEFFRKLSSQSFRSEAAAFRFVRGKKADIALEFLREFVLGQERTEEKKSCGIRNSRSPRFCRSPRTSRPRAFPSFNAGALFVPASNATSSGFWRLKKNTRVEGRA